MGLFVFAKNTFLKYFNFIKTDELKFQKNLNEKHKEEIRGLRMLLRILECVARTS